MARTIFATVLINGVNFPARAVADFCGRHGVARLSLFGSVLRDDFTVDSDVDVLLEFLVEFQPDRGPSLLRFAGMQLEFAELIDREAHLHTPAMLSPGWRERVCREANVQYAAA